ncbi:LicD family-domain-containing protein [Phaeosphaeria sp. MPI-PUGE-AT-0046c]|nr:LicD family-domain-containing protein [Phaeosphaeria sp. MPI-PUGE-AT-0046c]
MKLLPTDLLHLTTILLLYAPISAHPIPRDRRSAPFPSLAGLTPLTHDFSRPDTSFSSKFFHESTFSHHYDGRFASSTLPHATRLVHLRLMLRAYTVTMTKIGVRTWLMHGGLLGWWWGGKVMPWDTDLDYMVDEGGMGELGGWWNMSVHEFTHAEFGTWLDDEEEHHDNGAMDNDMSKSTKKKYLLEVNPQYTNTSTKDRANKIDARWIDTSTGLFIDITTLHVQPYSTLKPSAQSPSDPSSAIDPDTDIPLYTKDSHAYSSSQLFPLRLTTFEDTLTLVPYDYESVLLDEYGPDAITQRWYRGWKFDRDNGEGWVRDEEEEGGVWDGEGD